MSTITPLSAILTKKHPGREGLLLTRHPEKGLSPERPSGARNLSSQLFTRHGSRITGHGSRDTHQGPPVTSHQSPITKSFTMRTYIASAHKLFGMNTSKTQDLKPFRMNTYKKTGRGHIFQTKGFRFSIFEFPFSNFALYLSPLTVHYPLPTFFYGIRRILCSFSFALPDNFCSSFKPPMPQLARNGKKHSSRDCSSL